ncbi:MAG: GFA family protein, partial [Gammaproteobacteria bacterium]
HLMAEHPGMGLTDVYAAILPELPFAPGLHVFYAESKVRVKDGLPKYKDLPADFGGSGQTVPE